LNSAVDHNHITEVIHSYNPILLSEMDSVKLMKRVDTKFMVSNAIALDWLMSIKNKYRVLEIDGVRIQTYSTQYFDTEDLQFYFMHHNGKANRFKVRKREYRESNMAFLEIKRKDQKAVTHKSRIPADEEHLEEIINPEEPFIEDTLGRKVQLFPQINTAFRRITLASVEAQERITIDLDLNFETADCRKKPNGLVIIELKQAKFNANSVAFQELRKLGVRNASLSKYCIGMAMCNPNLKANAFKPKLRDIAKLK